MVNDHYGTTQRPDLDILKDLARHGKLRTLTEGDRGWRSKNPRWESPASGKCSTCGQVNPQTLLDGQRCMACLKGW